MPAMTIYAQERTNNALFHGDPLNPPAQWYLAMFTSAQDANETGTECADGNYARQAIAFNAWNAGFNKNNGAVTFCSASGLAADASIAALCLMDFPTGGNTWEFDNFAAPVDFSAGQSPRLTDQTLEASIS